MVIPKKIQEAIEKEIDNISLKELGDARAELTYRYTLKENSREPCIQNDRERMAYLLTRLPATFAVCKKVLSETLTHYPIQSLLDLGAGPGTASFAASEVFPWLKKMTLFEKDPAFIHVGKRLAFASEIAVLSSAQWEKEDLEKCTSFSLHDLVIFSYSIGELEELSALKLIDAAFEAAQEVLVVIEPGTPRGFERIRTLRRHLISLGGFMVAPCPHKDSCPMQGGNWCHFSERVARTSFHRKLKKGELGYEDEKFSYLIFSKKPASLPEARILRHPLKKGGHITFTLCTREGLKEETLSKKEGEIYKKARKLNWGDKRVSGECDHDALLL